MITAHFYIFLVLQSGKTPCLRWDGQLPKSVEDVIQCECCMGGYQKRGDRVIDPFLYSIS